MHLVQQRDTRPIESRDELVAYFLDACRPREQWLIGTEHELIGVRARAGRLGEPIGYDGPDGIAAIFDALIRAGWTAVHEQVGDQRHVIALVGSGIHAGSQITIEPGGQLELAAKPVRRAEDNRAEVDAYIDTLGGPSCELGLAWLGVGFRPFGRLDDVPWMPKQRYDIMRAYMPTVGTLGHEMMKRTATVQVNLDFSDADDARDKLRAALGAAPILTAIYACSPIVDGADSGFQSYRAEVWRHTDDARCGLLPLAFDDGDVFSAYTEWALDVPMYFVHRGEYLPAGGITFRQFWRDGFSGYRATIDDWALHLSTLFPDARLKRLIEVRSCDAGSERMVMALGPLCRGLFYDADALRATIALTDGLTIDERRALAADAARRGLRAQVGQTGRTVGELARELCAIAADGLRRQQPEELAYLEPVREIADSGRTQADEVIDLWRETGGDPAAVIPRLAYCCPKHLSDQGG